MIFTVPGADAKVRKEIAKDHYDSSLEKPSGDDLLLFYDEWSNRYFWKTFAEVKEAEYHLNRNLALRYDVELNEFYEFLGLEPTAFGAENGWSLEAGGQWYGYSWIDFEHELVESDDPDTPDFYMIVTPFGPTPDFLSYY